MKKIHVYAHTHWDYEWYFTASESIIQLIYHMDEVIDALQQGVMKTYLLDSQVSILEEYLNFMPDKKEVIQELVETGKLQIGPWYTQSDELIIAGESMIRNLWYGMKYANTFGTCLMIGYLPDSFGQSKDMPKIYQGFGIKDALFWRGVPSDIGEHREFIWKSNDDSQVYVNNIRDGYFYGGNLIYNDAVDEVENKILQSATISHQLLPVGGDQRFVDYDLKERIAYYNQQTTHNLHYEESDLCTYFEELHKAKLPVIEGEFIDASVSKIHHSIYSSRYDHKQLNDQIERRLIYQLEPFMVMQMQMGIAPKVSVLEMLWKKLLLNHAHDSACGCNSDATNRSILQRLIDCDQMSKMMLDYQVRKLSESIEGIEENDIVLYNTLPYTRCHAQKIDVNTRFENIAILDEKGNDVAFDIIASEQVYAGSIRKDESIYDPSLYYYHTQIYIEVEIAAMEMLVLKVKEGKSQQITCDSMSLENDTYKITENHGKLQLYIKKTKEIIDDFLYIEDGGDDGDSYDYSYPQQDVIYELNFNEASISYTGNIHPCMHIKGVWNLPLNLQARECKQKNGVIPYELCIQLQHEELHVHLKIENKAIEHRMRVVLRSTIQCNHSIADTAFGTIRRALEEKHINDWQACGYREEPTAIYPVLHHVSMQDDTRYMSCMLKGIKEYEIIHKHDMALTLFRSVPYLGKPDLLRRPGIASGNEFQYIETPDATLCQSMTFSFGIVYGTNYDELHVHNTWMKYANDFLYYQIQELNRFVNTQKYFVTHPYKNKIKRCSGTLSLDNLKSATFSSLIPLDEHRFALRIYNTRDEDVMDENILLTRINKVNETNLYQEVVENDIAKNHNIEVDHMKKEEIKTYELFIK